MDRQERLKLYTKALDKYGIMPQVLMVVEECGELLSALSKYNRHRVESPEVITELADVSIMVEQLATYFGYDKFKEEKQRKLERLKSRLDENK